MHLNLIGRKEEIALLEQIYHSAQPEFLALYGRRRIGKTFLIRQFFKQKKAIFFNATGSKEGARCEQIRYFTEQIGNLFYGGILPVPPADWEGAFALLTKVIQQQSKKKKIVLFLDELPWMATPKSGVLQSLDYYWNQYWSNDARIKLIICGASAAWIINKVIKNKGGLHNRITHRMRLGPFTLSQTNCFHRAMFS